MKIDRKDRSYYKTIITTQQLKSNLLYYKRISEQFYYFTKHFSSTNLQAFEVSCTCKKLFIEYRRERAKNIVVRKRLKIEVTAEDERVSKIDSQL